jgi:thiol:disulfide interchange protein DsbD
MRRHTLFIIGLPLLLFFTSFQTQAKEALLPVDEAFQLTPPAVKDQTIQFQWKIAPHYHLYKKRIAIKSQQAELGRPNFPKGEVVDDPIFGRTTIYENALTINVPIVRAPKTFDVSVSYQGCNGPQGVCYPPQKRTFTLTLPQAIHSPTAENAKIPSPAQTEGGFGRIGSLNDLNNALIEDSGSELLPAEEAFQFSSLPAKDKLILSWQVAPGYHLYQDKIKIKPLSGDLKLGKLQLPPAEEANDPVFGNVLVYKAPFQAELPINAINSPSKIEVTYQGCSDETGVCYPPIHKTLSLNPADFTVSGNGALASASVKTAGNAADELSETDQITSTLKNQSLWIILGTFFIFGLLLAFTPCVFPMIPILSSIIVGQGEGLTTRKAFTLSLVYVLAMSVTYTVAGVLAGLFGENLQAAFQNPWILGTFSAIFVLLALSMFGFYELQLPSSLQSKLTQVANKQQGGTLAGVAIMGFLSALIVGPCVAPPLAGALIYIGQTGDALLGGSALFAMSLGMGLPLLLLGTSAGKLLPKAGAWMDVVKAVFGVLLLAVALWMAERILPEWMTTLSWALLLIVSAIYMGAFSATENRSGWFKLFKGLAIALFAWGMFILTSLALGQPSLLQPLKGLQGGGTVYGGKVAAKELHFKQIKGLDQLQAEVGKGQPVMLDFYADWCVSCKEMEHQTFADPKVQQALQGFKLLQADVTPNDATDKALMKQFGIIGPPAILFFTPDGKEIKALRIVGFKPPEAFIEIVNKAKNTEQ